MIRIIDTKFNLLGAIDDYEELTFTRKEDDNMSKVLYYYAKINENNVCYGFETLTKKFKEEDKPSNLVYLVDYNESVLWKKWLGKDKGWSMESYEPSIDTIIQDKVEALETENANLKGQITDLNTTISGLNDNMSLLEGTITELTTILAQLKGGAV